MVSVLVGRKSASLARWIVWPPVIQHKERSLTKYWDQAEIEQKTELTSRTNLANAR